MTGTCRICGQTARQCQDHFRTTNGAYCCHACGTSGPAWAHRPTRGGGFEQRAHRVVHWLARGWKAFLDWIAGILARIGAAFTSAAGKLRDDAPADTPFDNLPPKPQ